MSRRNVIVAKAVELLQIAAGSGVTVHRHAMRPIEKDQLPALCIYVVGVKPAQDGQTWGLREYDLDLRVEVRTTGQPVDQVLDQLIETVQAVMLREPFLGGAAFGVKEGEIQYDALDRDKVYAAAAIDFTVRFCEDPTGQGQEPFEPPFSTAAFTAPIEVFP